MEEVTLLEALEKIHAINPAFKWATRDVDGRVDIWLSQPNIQALRWWGGDFLRADQLFNIKQEGDWRESLVSIGAAESRKGATSE